MEEVVHAIVLDSDSEFEEDSDSDYNDSPSTFALAYGTIPDSRYLNRGTRCHGRSLTSAITRPW